MVTTSPVVVSSIANVCWRACKSHPIILISASFGPSTVRVNTETVYSDRREAGVVMTSNCLDLDSRVSAVRSIRSNCLAGNFRHYWSNLCTHLLNHTFRRVDLCAGITRSEEHTSELQS